jgi:xylan 1,4-beta-xylosidase
MTAPASNPVLPGFNPDPTICRAGPDYFLVTSSFEYFPGLPLYHSLDLVHWRQLGHVLDRPSQLPLDGVRSSGGLYAPTLRQHGGTSYLVCTLVGGTAAAGNFVVTAPHPAGPWSEPVWLTDAPGFDPALYFGDDGRAWFLGTRPVPGAQTGRTEIWLREFDPAALRLTGPEHILFRGALADALWAEAPRLLRRAGYHYLILAEGGTEYHHAVTVARSEQVTGPYRGNPANPVLTHRHLGRGQPVTGPGHADFVQTEAGDWHAVLLATRSYQGGLCNLGRETFLASVSWQDGWPVINPGAGRLLPEFSPPLPAHPWPPEPPVDDFGAATLGPAWLLLRTPREEFWSLTARPGYLRLRLRPEMVTQPCNPSFVGRRQQHLACRAATALDFEPAADGECAGLVVLRGTENQIQLLVTGVAGGGKAVRVTVRRAGREEIVAQAPLGPGRVFLAAEAAGRAYVLRCTQDPARWQTLATVDAGLLSLAAGGEFTGACLGMYASSNGRPSATCADFDWFEYTGHD